MLYVGGWLLFTVYRFDPESEVRPWVTVTWHVIVIGIALVGWSSWTSVAALLFIGFGLSFSADDILMSAKFYSLVWLAVAAVALRFLYVTRSLPALLILVGSFGCFVITCLHAFGRYTQQVILDVMGWTHLAYERLDEGAGFATICLPLGLLLFIRRRRAGADAATPGVVMKREPTVLFPICAFAFVSLLLVSSIFHVTCSGDGRMSATSIKEESILRSIYEREQDHLVSGLEFRDEGDYHIVGIPDKQGKPTWVMLDPRSAPYYKELKVGEGYSVTQDQIWRIDDTHHAISTVRECLVSHCSESPCN